ncbi:NAD(P)/FAD-dependent oxidoreductase [Bacillus sp. SCS-151]|uniref:NAD(P)/FAD-dependent oxidoreductase n=1 Tax=Nanhaiella sioensis TaxID=3115293 RepID=UPI00397C282F
MVENDCLIIGGGIAGLQAAIQLGRYNHRITVIDNNQGRSSICRCYHNILGWPHGVSGEKLRQLGKEHAIGLGVCFIKDKIVDVRKQDELFVLIGEKGDSYKAKRVLFATGIVERFPNIPKLVPCLGLTVYVCPDCDGYEVTNKKVIVIGSGNVGASLAITLTYWSENIVYVNHGKETIKQSLLSELSEHHITLANESITEIIVQGEGQFSGVQFGNGEIIMADRGFIGFGGNKVNSDLAYKLGVERMENHHIVTNHRTKETSVKNIWAAGDITIHSEQVTLAMGEGAQAAIWIHKRILEER